MGIIFLPFCANNSRLAASGSAVYQVLINNKRLIMIEEHYIEK
jgi:hypothetical protein